MQELASIISLQNRAETENGENVVENGEVLSEEATDTKRAERVQPSFTYVEPKPVTPDNVPRLHERPMAVPPSDFRFYENGNAD